MYPSLKKLSFNIDIPDSMTLDGTKGDYVSLLL